MNHSTWRFYLLNDDIGTLDLRDFEINSGMLRGNDHGGQRCIKPIKNILFAFPANKILDVKPHIKTAQPSKSVKKAQSKVNENEEELKQAVQKNIVLTMHGDYVIRGKLQKFDNHRLFVHVGNTQVQVYQHGIFKFEKETVPNETKANEPHKVKRQPEHVEANRRKKEKDPIQTEANDLDELRQKREGWVESSRENNFEEGIKHLLTDLYPDNAHFIYELLQNAEDAGASEVQFILTNDQVKFEHNGGRLFSEKDVEAITSIGDSHKKDDPTNIGKFGIGFKAVFAYTSTPEIESGGYHFRIQDMVVPDTRGLAPGALGERKTRFIFPFNNPEKPPDKARPEIEKNLRELNESTLLFLSNIRKIEYCLPDSSDWGSLERREEKQDSEHIQITVRHPEDSIPNSTHYLRFEKTVSVRDGADDELKNCKIGVAFRRAHVEGRGWKIIPLPGQICIYFPAVKETSKLQFHMHAPFASTVARDSVRECSANTELLNHLADLTAESMSEVRDRDLLDVDFLAVLPNDRDNLSADYLPIQKRLVEAFKNKKLTPMKKGGHAAASGIYRGDRELSALIQDEDLARLLGKDTSLPLWVADPQQKRDARSGQFIQDSSAQRISNFLKDMLDISEWKTENLVEALDTRPDMIVDWLREKSEEWHQRLYVLLGTFLSSAPEYPIYVARERKDKLLPLSIVRCDDSSYRAGGQCHFLDDDTESDVDLFSGPAASEGEPQRHIQDEDGHEENFHYVAKGVYSSGQNEDQQEKARKLLETIGVREVDETERIKMILKQRYMGESIQPHEADLERFIKLVEADSSKAELFKSYPIFQIDKNLDNKRWWAPPERIFLDRPYLDTGLKTYYEIIGENSDNFRWALSSKYAEPVSAPERLGKFAEAVGAQTQLQIRPQEIPVDHPWETYLRDAPGDRWTDSGIDEDYTILKLEILYNPPSIAKAQLIWRTMYSLLERYLKARFRLNQSNELRTAHSSLVHNLREAEWVPQKHGDSISFVLPREASIEHLPEGFPYEAEQQWLKDIEFGKTAREQEEEHLERNKLAQKVGFNSGDEAEKMVEVVNALKEQGKSVDELLDKLSEDFGISKRRAERLTIELSDAEERQYEIRARSIRSTRSTIDPRTTLQARYTDHDNNMDCQMCREEMPFKKRNSNDDYFEAVEALTREHFPKEHEAQYLALCPVCAAKYKEYVKKDSVTQANLYNILKDSEASEVKLELNNGVVIDIWFEEKHWHDLKTVLFYYENVHNPENSID